MNGPQVCTISIRALNIAASRSARRTDRMSDYKGSGISAYNTIKLGARTRCLRCPRAWVTFISAAHPHIVDAKFTEFNPLAEKLYPTRHTTIGSVIDAGLRIHAFCLDCSHNEDLDLSAVARKLGRNCSSLPMHLVPKLVCSNCGGKNVGTVLAPAEQELPKRQVDHVSEEWRARHGDGSEGEN